MLNFSVCPHDTQKGLERWKTFVKRLEESLGERVNFEVLKGSVEEYKRIEEGNFFDLYYAGPFVTPFLYEKGYKPVAKFRGQRDRFFLLVRDGIPEEGSILVAVPFLKPIGYPLISLDTERIRLVFTNNFYEVFSLLREKEVHAGIMYSETWDEIEESEKEGLRVLEDYVFDTSHIFMVKRELYYRIKNALLSFEELETAGEEDIQSIIKLHREFDKFLRLWSGASLAQSLKEISHIGVLVYGENVLFANKGFLRFSGYTLDEIRNTDVFTLIDKMTHPDYRSLLKSLVKRQLSGEHPTIDYGELQLFKKDGSTLWTLIASVNILYEGNYAGALFLVDITKRKRLERFYRLLKEVNRTVTQVVLEEELLERICKGLVDKMGIKFVWVCAFNQEGNIESVYSLKDKPIVDLESSSEDSILFKAYREDRIVVNPDVRNSDLPNTIKHEMIEMNLLSSCAIPVSKGNGKTYVFVLYAEEPYYFQEDAKDILYELKYDVEFALKRLEELWRNTLVASALENSTSWVLICDSDGTITYANDAVSQISGYSKEEVLGKKPSIFKSGYHSKEFYENLWNTILSGKEFHAVFVNRKKDGELFYTEQNIYPVNLPNGALKFISVGKDITREVYLSSEIERLTFYDPVTGLLNLDGLRLKAIESMSGSKRNALFLIDVCGMSLINKKYGIKVGDEVLAKLAQRLKSEFGNYGVIGRVAGDEFALFVPIEKEEEVIFTADKIEEVLDEPITLESGDRLTISINMGIAVTYGEAFNQVHEKASVALASAKKAGEGERRFFEPDFEERVKQITFAIELVGRAIEEDSFVFYYQPYYRSEDLKLAGFETLVRIRERDGSIYGPNYFIDYLENSKHLKSFEGIALRKVLEFYHKVRLPLSINVSARSFMDKSFISTLTEQTKDSLISVEITERVLLSDPEKTLEHAIMLREAGIRLLIDDFGTGYSSLAYISTFPVDGVKIDISFVRDMVFDSRKRAVIKHIIGLSRDIGIETFAEGVESQKQLIMLREMGCTYIQGYLLGKPMPEEEAVRIFSMV
ncbi:MAG: EAL domain-containing protein [Aquificaceae bacterium]|nr:EAL domain-containing protein [Aquificaceae bacterium]MDW8422959.1 EAL domain-containing protein [Aquificaceae bacterium]